MITLLSSLLALLALPPAHASPAGACGTSLGQRPLPPEAEKNADALKTLGEAEKAGGCVVPVRVKTGYRAPEFDLAFALVRLPAKKLPSAASRGDLDLSFLSPGREERKQLDGALASGDTVIALCPNCFVSGLETISAFAPDKRDRIAAFREALGMPELKHVLMIYEASPAERSAGVPFENLPSRIVHELKHVAEFDSGFNQFHTKKTEELYDFLAALEARMKKSSVAQLEEDAKAIAPAVTALFLSFRELSAMHAQYSFDVAKGAFGRKPTPFLEYAVKHAYLSGDGGRNPGLLEMNKILADDRGRGEFFREAKGGICALVKSVLQRSSLPPAEQRAAYPACL